MKFFYKNFTFNPCGDFGPSQGHFFTTIAYPQAYFGFSSIIENAIE